MTLEFVSQVPVRTGGRQRLRDTFLTSGRVTFLPVSEILEDDDGPADNREWAIAGMLSGERRSLRARKLVDATMLQTSIPVTHKRAFVVAEGVECIPPNDLIRAAANFTRFTVLGSGKTALDSLLWLLANGAKPEAISWVLPPKLRRADRVIPESDRVCGPQLLLQVFGIDAGLGDHNSEGGKRKRH